MDHKALKKTRDHITLTAVGICATASLFYIYEYLIRVMPSAISHNLMSFFNINAAGLGFLSSLFFWGYASMQIPAGMVYDKFGARKVLAAAIFLCSLATIAFAMTDIFLLAGVARLVSGFTAAFAFTGALYVGIHWLPRKHFAAYAGAVQFFGCVGAILGQGPIAYLADHVGWRFSVFIIAGSGLIFTALITIFVKDNTESLETLKHHQQAQKHVSYIAIFKCKQNWWLAIYAFFCWTPIITFAALWGVPYLNYFHHLGNTHAAFATSFIWVGAAFGAPILGYWSNHIHRRKPALILSSLVGFVVSILIIYCKSAPYSLLLALLFIYGFAASVQSVVFGNTQDINRRKFMGAAIGFVNMAMISGGVLIQPLMGYILQHIGTDTFHNNVPIYPIHSYQIAFVLIPAAFLAALLCAIFLIKETHCVKKPLY